MSHKNIDLLKLVIHHTKTIMPESLVSFYLQVRKYLKKLYLMDLSTSSSLFKTNSERVPWKRALHRPLLNLAEPHLRHIRRHN